MEIWGGLECTLNRVGDRRFDQLDRAGHNRRPGDLEKIAALGIRTLRYPLLWEHVVRNATADPDWSHADARLAEMRELGIAPIAGLVHHGSGPDHAGLCTEAFAPALAEYAGAVARRYPWIEQWTPVNEPLTTARFCGLYGHWHPHGRDSRTFARALVNQCRAIVLAMHEIRRVNPRARLVQTDDLGTVYGSRRLQHQVDFENGRRWLAWDLLCGRVGSRHPFHRHLLRWGIGIHELAWLEEHPCPPDVIGVDHYVTSDRYLDDDVGRYPAELCGGNGRERYVDVEAVRVRSEPGTSLRQIVTDAAWRYQTPVVLTEVHIGCSVDEQIRWLHEAWSTSRDLAAHRVDVRAVTAWALLGSYDWDSLVTRDEGSYEAGAFTLADGVPRRTRLADHIAALASGSAAAFAQSLPAGSGWWRRDERLVYRREGEWGYAGEGDSPRARFSA